MRHGKCAKAELRFNLGSSDSFMPVVLKLDCNLKYPGNFLYLGSLDLTSRDSDSVDGSEVLAFISFTSCLCESTVQAGLGGPELDETTSESHCVEALFYTSQTDFCKPGCLKF